MRYRLLAAMLLAAIVASPLVARASGAYTPVHAYDPARDADKDVKEAVAEAARTNKRVLVEVGGQWCVWCRIMDKYFDEHTDLTAYRDAHFVTVKVNFSEENENKAVLSRYPAIEGYPHIFVLGSDGALLHSQNTGDLEAGKSYDLDKFTAFLHTWAPSAG